MRATAAGLSDVGRERRHNEDCYVLVPEHNVFVVADGMGGHQSGEIASGMAASVIEGYYREGNARRRRGSTAERLRAAVSDANAKIFARADDSRLHRGMGTTVVAGAFSPREKMFYIAHAGDSRCYLLRDGGITQLTRDHSLLQDALLERPDLTESDLAYLPRNVITRALGISPVVEVDLRAERVELGDLFLLCSDGLHGLVDDREIARIVWENAVLPEACMQLIECANQNGGRDNITAVLVRIEKEPASWGQQRGSRGQGRRAPR